MESKIKCLHLRWDAEKSGNFLFDTNTFDTSISSRSETASRTKAPTCPQRQKKPGQMRLAALERL